MDEQTRRIATLIERIQLGPIRLAGLISATNAALRYTVAEPISRITETKETGYKAETQVRGSWHPLQ